jgi:hypothetical protein
MPMNIPGLSPAGQSLGLGGIAGLGTTLGDQVAGETEEQRKKRMLELQQRQLLGPGGSAAASSLFGGLGSTTSGGF